MGLSNDLLSQFAKITKDEKQTKKETTVYDTTVENNGKTYVKIDGSDLLTPASTTINTKNGERVTVMLKNHTATITGNVSSPSARLIDINEINEETISELNAILANKADVANLNVEKARIDTLVTDNATIKEKLTASEAEIDSLQSSNLNITERLTANEAEIDYLKSHSLDTETAGITYATITELDTLDADINMLEANYADFKNTTTNTLTAHTASINSLEANKLSASDIEGKYANIDFSNIGKAAMQYFYSKSGLIQNVIIGDSTITGQLVGVTISGDLIEDNTVVAEKLVTKGTDGLYYKLNTDGIKNEAEQTDYNSLNGSVIKAKSITATKISVDDLVAFDATIGGFNIIDSAIYSGVKSSVDNTTSGLYMDKNGQMALGDASSFVKYYKDQNGDYHLEISAQSVLMSTQTVSEEPQNKTVEDVIAELSETTSTTAYDLANCISSTNSELENLQGQIDSSLKLIQDLNNRVIALEKKGE